MSAYKIISVGVLRLHLLFLFLLLGGSFGGIVGMEPYVEPLHEVSVDLAKWIRSISFSYDGNSFSHHGAYHYFPLSSPC